MRTFLLAPVVAFAFVAAAGAEPIQIEVPTDIEPAKSQLTRAEVIADSHMWRLAGLQDLTRGEYVDTNSYEYRRAFATYVHLRSSTQYAALVKQLQQNPNASVVARRQTVLAAQTSK